MKKRETLSRPHSPTLTPRHERDQSFLAPVPVPSETNFGAGPSQKYFGHGPGPGPKKTFWSRSCSEKIMMLVLVKKNFGPGPGPGQKKNLVPVPPGPGQKKNFGPGTGTTLLISK